MPEGWRTVVIEDHERLELRNDCLVLKKQEEEKSIPLNQLRDLILSYPSGSITLPLLQRLSKEQVNVILCDEKRKPMATIHGLNQHIECAGHLMDQAAWSVKRKDAVWKQIARQKITMQANLLAKLQKPEESDLRRLARGVRLGDHTNREGIAARLYFTVLFGKGFVRHAPDNQNAALNYGYTILNTAMSRIIILHGYQTGLGVHHCGRTNPVNLTCDLMEPFRPLVDQVVFEHGDAELDWPYKQALIGLLQGRCVFDGKHTKIADAMDAFALNIFAAMEGERREIGVIGFE